MASTVQDDRWRRDRSAKAAQTLEAAVRITQQFRERHNMTYEIDCSGIPLVLRVFFPLDDASRTEWRIEASAGETRAVASASSRAQALQQVAQNWRDTMPLDRPNLDWSGVAQAMTSVRAI